MFNSFTLYIFRFSYTSIFQEKVFYVVTYPVYVYEHALVIMNNQLITRKFIVLRDCNKHIVAWTDHHKYIQSGKNKVVHNISEDGNKRSYYVSGIMDLSYVSW